MDGLFIYSCMVGLSVLLVSSLLGLFDWLSSPKIRRTAFLFFIFYTSILILCPFMSHSANYGSIIWTPANNSIHRIKSHKTFPHINATPVT